MPLNHVNNEYKEGTSIRLYVNLLLSVRLFIALKDLTNSVKREKQLSFVYNCLKSIIKGPELIINLMILSRRYHFIYEINRIQTLTIISS